MNQLIFWRKLTLLWIAWNINHNEGIRNSVNDFTSVEFLVISATSGFASVENIWEVENIVKSGFVKTFAIVDT